MEEYPYAVVKFVSDDTYSEVPVLWLSADEEFCFWPKTARNLYKLMAKRVKPEPHWEKYAVTVENKCKTLIQARRKAENAETTENEESLMGKGKRRKKGTKILSSSTMLSSSSESDDGCYTPPPEWPIKSKKSKKPTESKLVSQTIVSEDNELTEATQEYLESLGQNNTVNAVEELEEVPLPIVVPLEASDDPNGVIGHLNFIPGTPASLSSTISVDSTKLNTLLDICTSINLYVKSIDARLKLVEQNKREVEDDNTISSKMPLDTLDALRDFEKELTNESDIRNKFVQYITSIGGRHPKDIVNRILKRLYTNQLGTSCSWLGQRDNFRICDLITTKLIKQVVMNSCSNIKERDFENYVSEWFRLSRLRLQREKK